MSDFQVLDQICQTTEEALKNLKAYREQMKKLPHLYDKLNISVPSRVKAQQKINTTTPKPTKAKGRRSGGGPSLRQVLWNILSEKQNLAHGLPAGEIVKSIAASGIWSTDSGEIGTQVSVNLSNMKKSGLLERINKKYKIVKGAKLI